MKIAVIGTGYVGLTLGVGMALKGNEAWCVDIVPEKVEKINAGIPPIYEEGLEEALKGTVGSNLKATTSIDEAVKDSKIIFIAVGTPSREDGSIDLKYIEQVSRDIGEAIKKLDDFKVVCVKSTVVPETTTKTVLPIIEETSGKKCGVGFGLCMNPEFLQEGTAMKDFMEPDRIVIGEFDSKSGDVLNELYSNFDAPILRTDLTVAEMIKYTANSLLAVKISFSNEIGNICKRLGIDTYDVMKGVGFDKRLGPHFLNAGCGFGGSCFPKDVRALLAKSRDLGYEPHILNETLEINKKQKTIKLDLLKEKLPDVAGKKISVLGLAFKPGTDDTRESPALEIIPKLREQGANVVVYDPLTHVKNQFPDVEHAKSVQEALSGSDACLIVTDWPEFKSLENKDFESMNNRLIIEGRRTLDKGKVEDFHGVCW